MKRVYLVALIVALMVGAATFFFAQGLIEKSSIQDAPTQTVVVAVSDLQSGTMITADMDGTVFVTKKVLVEDVIPGAVTNIEEIMGKVAVQDLYTGEQISMRRFSDQGGDDAALSYTLLEGEVAYSIKAEDVKGVDGYVVPGDTVDIVVATSDDGEKVTGAELVFQNLKVLKVATKEEVVDAKADTTNEGEVKTYVSITVKTTEEQAVQLYAMEQMTGEEFKLILNSRVEAEKIN